MHRSDSRSGLVERADEKSFDVDFTIAVQINERFRRVYENDTPPATEGRSDYAALKDSWVQKEKEVNESRFNSSVVESSKTTKPTTKEFASPSRGAANDSGAVPEDNTPVDICGPSLKDADDGKNLSLKMRLKLLKESNRVVTSRKKTPAETVVDLNAVPESPPAITRDISGPVVGSSSTVGVIDEDDFYNASKRISRRISFKGNAADRFANVLKKFGTSTRSARPEHSNAKVAVPPVAEDASNAMAGTLRSFHGHASYSVAKRISTAHTLDGHVSTPFSKAMKIFGSSVQLGFEFADEGPIYKRRSKTFTISIPDAPPGAPELFASLSHFEKRASVERDTSNNLRLSYDIEETVLEALDIPMSLDANCKACPADDMEPMEEENVPETAVSSNNNGRIMEKSIKQEVTDCSLTNNSTVTRKSVSATSMPNYFGNLEVALQAISGDAIKWIQYLVKRMKEIGPFVVQLMESVCKLVDSLPSTKRLLVAFARVLRGDMSRVAERLGWKSSSATKWILTIAAKCLRLFQLFEDRIGKDITLFLRGILPENFMELLMSFCEKSMSLLSNETNIEGERKAHALDLFENTDVADN